MLLNLGHILWMRDHLHFPYIKRHDFVSKDHHTSSPKMACFCWKLIIKKRANKQQSCTILGCVLWVWAHPFPHLKKGTLHTVCCRCEHTYIVKRKPYIPYIVGVGSPILFQEAKSFSYTLYVSFRCGYGYGSVCRVPVCLLWKFGVCQVADKSLWSTSDSSQYWSLVYRCSLILGTNGVVEIVNYCN